MPRNLALAYVLCGLSIVVSHQAKYARAAIVVAAADSLEQERRRADFVCDGVDDQEELAASLALARQGEIQVDIDPGHQQSVTCAVNHVVEWLPGTYQLSATLEVPAAANCVIRAEGTKLRYMADSGDAVVIRGMNACRYQFGTIESRSKGAALCVRPQANMPALMSFVDFAALVGHSQRGTGLLLDPAHENVCVNRFVGTDIAGFETGVMVGGAGGRDGSASTQSKCDTNWFWLSYIRLCRTCIVESAQGVDCSVWEVNVDASVSDGVAIRAGGKYGKWYIIMGTFMYEKKNLALVLEPGAKECVIEVHPSLENFAWEDRSGDESNVIFDGSVASTKPASITSR